MEDDFESTLDVSKIYQTSALTLNLNIIPGQTQFCHTYNEEGFDFIHPKTTCDLRTCQHFFICRQWEIEQQQAKRAPSGAILSLSQSVVPYIVDSPSVQKNMYLTDEEKTEILTRQNQERQRLEQQLIPDKDTPANYPVVGSGTAHLLCGTKIIKGCLERHPAKQLNDIIDHQKDLEGNCIDNGAELHVFKCSCHRPLCPVCNGSWKKRAVSRVWERFTAYGDTLTPEEKRQRKLCHVLFSPPKTMHHKTMAEMQKQALIHAKQLGIDAGTIIYHSKRQIERIKGNWTYENTYFSPHFHVFAPIKKGWVQGPEVKNRPSTTKISKETGWTIRNFGKRDLKRNISYQLGHAGVPTNHAHIVKWFGEMNYRKLHVEKYKPTQATCSWGHPLDRYVHYVGKDKNPIIQEEPGYIAIVKKEGWIYLPKKRKKETYDPGGEYEDEY